MITNPRVRVLDASSAHRVTEGWVYGYPELTPGQEGKIRAAKRVSNPGCYPTGALALIRPLTDAGILPQEHGITITAVSGYSGGGKEVIALCENPELQAKPEKDRGRGGSFSLYGLEQKHKHLPEMRIYGGLTEDPIFLPSYCGSLYRGMLIEIALRLKGMKRQTGIEVTGELIHKALVQRYAGKKYIKVEPLQTKLEAGYVLSPAEQNETNNVHLRVFWNLDKEIVVLTAAASIIWARARRAPCGTGIVDMMPGLGGASDSA